MSFIGSVSFLFIAGNYKYVIFCDRNRNCNGWNRMSSSGVRVKAVLFDLGDTLVSTAEIPEIYSRILKAKGIKRSLREISLAYKGTERHLNLKEYAGPYDEFWITWNLHILDKLRIRENAKYLARTIDKE